MTSESCGLFNLHDDVRLHVFQILLGYLPGYRSGDHARLQDLRRFRLTCKTFRDLIDSGVTSFSCDLEPTLSRNPAHPPWSLLQRAFSPRAVTPTVRHLDSADTFLQRVPRLLSLGLRGWASEGALVSQLQRLGCAIAGRRGPTRLHLTGTRLTTSALTAVRRSLPHLRELHVTDTAVRSYTCGHTWGPYLLLNPSLFESLQANQLTKLTYYNPTAHAGQHVLRRLGGLSRLVHLDLTLGSLHGNDSIQHLSGLVSLQHCSMVSVVVSTMWTESFFAALLNGSRTLTLLRLHGWFCDVDFASADLLFPSPLAGLTRLRSLDLGRDFMVDDGVWHRVSRLTLLTMLGVAALRLTHPVAGCLPHLQHLAVACSRSGYDFTPLADLDRSLLPLLPLPSLVRLDIAHLCHGHLVGGAEEAAALHSFVRHLADAPHLHLEGNWHFCAWADHFLPHFHHHLTHAQLASAMKPLEGRVTFTESTYGSMRSMSYD